MKKEIKDKAASVKARLLNVSRKSKIDFDALLLRYFQERFLYRLMLSEFSDNFILKGGFLLLCLNIPLSRPTKDIDFLARGIKNAESGFKNIFKRVAKVSCDDGVDFEPSSVFSERIIIDAQYKGIRLKINACLGKARKTLQFDIGFGDAIWPEPMLMVLPIAASHSASARKPEQVSSTKLKSRVGVNFPRRTRLLPDNSCVMTVGMTARADWRGP